jgi:pimeloyl-ACP methyl ester carboxylesterase
VSVHTFTINGIDLVYEKEGSGPPLLFLHGGNTSAVYWEHIVPHFMGHYTCFVLEQRGHGRSGRSATVDYAMATLVEDCLEFVGSVVGPAVLVGHSMGGAVAMGDRGRAAGPGEGRLPRGFGAIDLWSQGPAR